MEPQRYEDIDSVIKFAEALPDFPNKSFVLERLETRNMNRYQEALATLNELFAEADAPGGIDAKTKSGLQELANRLARLEASDPVGG